MPDCKIVTTERRPTAVIRLKARMSELREAQQTSRARLAEALPTLGVSPLEHSCTLWRPPVDGVLDMEPGVLVSGPFAPAGDVVPSELPAGRAAYFLLRGLIRRAAGRVEDAPRLVCRREAPARGRQLGDLWPVAGRRTRPDRDSALRPVGLGERIGRSASNESADSRAVIAGERARLAVSARRSWRPRAPIPCTRELSFTRCRAHTDNWSLTDLSKLWHGCPHSHQNRERRHARDCCASGIPLSRRPRDPAQRILWVTEQILRTVLPEMPASPPSTTGREGRAERAQIGRKPPAHTILEKPSAILPFQTRGALQPVIGINACGNCGNCFAPFRARQADMSGSGRQAVQRPEVANPPPSGRGTSACRRCARP